jgi:hypothetical protein
VDDKVSELEEELGKNNLLIFGFEDRKDEGYYDALLQAVTKVLRE